MPFLRRPCDCGATVRPSVRKPQEVGDRATERPLIDERCKGDVAAAADDDVEICFKARASSSGKFTWYRILTPCVKSMHAWLRIHQLFKVKDRYL